MDCIGGRKKYDGLMTFCFAVDTFDIYLFGVLVGQKTLSWHYIHRSIHMNKIQLCINSSLLDMSLH